MAPEANTYRRMVTKAVALTSQVSVGDLSGGTIVEAPQIKGSGTRPQALLLPGQRPAAPPRLSGFQSTGSAPPSCSPRPQAQPPHGRDGLPAPGPRGPTPAAPRAHSPRRPPLRPFPPERSSTPRQAGPERAPGKRGPARQACCELMELPETVGGAPGPTRPGPSASLPAPPPRGAVAVSAVLPPVGGSPEPGARRPLRAPGRPRPL
uniref:basic proline-rich protein-like n=1 Tax=Odobenus rosmarus divergens TaxID=9708 RepID=UPI00063C246C|nr:PREDICTED: basic proline-rich protein-like [Odobenus rosmarus divergens]